uniref:Uncharacterized protein n=1 Tax=Anguilla anguilla TaxID=7936 RepID=A0A0E9PJS4_ANGAN
MSVEDKKAQKFQNPVIVKYRRLPQFIFE